MPAAPLSIAMAALLACAGVAAPAATQVPPPDEPHARTRQIAELAFDLGYGAELTHIDAAIPYLAALLARNDPTWKPSHPRWNDVCALIGQTLRTDAQVSFAETERTVVQKAEHALNETLSQQDLTDTLEYFHSPLGRRFLALQNALTDVGIEATLSKDSGPSTPPEDVVEARRRLIELWPPVLFIRALYPAASAQPVIDGAFARLSALRGPKLDALAGRYADELPQFEAFVKSPPFVHAMDAEKLSGPVTAPPDLGAFFEAEARRHGAEWHAAYLGI